MGLLDRLIGGLNRGERAVSDAQHAVFRDRGFEHAETLAAEGGRTEGVVTGIDYRLNDSTTEARYRLEWRDPEPRVAAVLFGGAAPAVLRLGSTVPLRVDGREAALDVGLLGLPGEEGRHSRKVPEPGVADTSIDGGAQRRLRKWPREAGAVVVSFDRVTALGMPTENWDVVVRRADGSTATVRKAWVPPYCHRLLAPGVPVPVAVDAGDPTRAEIDWPALAVANAGGRWQDDVPPGSVAALLT